jgi:hypothetical protein
MAARALGRQPRPVRETDTEVFPFGIYLGIGSALIVFAAVVAAAVFPVGQTLDRLAVLVVATALFAAVVPDVRASLGVVVLGYLLFDGFLENEYGQLTWDGMTGLWRIGMLFSAVGLGLAGRWLFRKLHLDKESRGA